jgi:hypothetical protein
MVSSHNRSWLPKTARPIAENGYPRFLCDPSQSQRESPATQRTLVAGPGDALGWSM